MSFKLPKNAGSFFRNLLAGGNNISRFETQFDAYYFCVMAGLNARQLGDLNDVGEEFYRDYAQSFQPYADLIAGLLIDAELCRMRIDADDRSGIETVITGLLDPQSATRLSLEGHRLLDRYAAAGLTIVSEAFPTPPGSLEEFFVFYRLLWARGSMRP